MFEKPFGSTIFLQLLFIDLYAHSLLSIGTYFDISEQYTFTFTYPVFAISVRFHKL